MRPRRKRIHRRPWQVEDLVATTSQQPLSPTSPSPRSGDATDGPPAPWATTRAWSPTAPAGTAGSSRRCGGSASQADEKRTMTAGRKRSRHPPCLSLGCWVSVSEKRYVERHVAELVGDADGAVHRLLHAVAGDVALDELVLAALAHLEHQVPLAVHLANHRLLAEDDGARACLEVTLQTGRNERAAEARIHNTDAEGVHENGLHHLAVEENEGNGLVVYVSSNSQGETERNIRHRITHGRDRLQTNDQRILKAVDVHKSVGTEYVKKGRPDEHRHKVLSHKHLKRAIRR